eukprot:gene24224-biopygen7379
MVQGGGVQGSVPTPRVGGWAHITAQFSPRGKGEWPALGHSWWAEVCAGPGQPSATADGPRCALVPASPRPQLMGRGVRWSRPALGHSWWAGVCAGPGQPSATADGPRCALVPASPRPQLVGRGVRWSRPALGHSWEMGGTVAWGVGGGRRTAHPELWCKGHPWRGRGASLACDPLQEVRARRDTRSPARNKNVGTPRRHSICSSPSKLVPMMTLHVHSKNHGFPSAQLPSRPWSSIIRYTAILSNDTPPHSEEEIRPRFSQNNVHNWFPGQTKQWGSGVGSGRTGGRPRFFGVGQCCFAARARPARGSVGRAGVLAGPASGAAAAPSGAASRPRLREPPPPGGRQGEGACAKAVVERRLLRARLL